MKKYLVSLCTVLFFCSVGFAQHTAEVTLNTDAANYITKLGQILTVNDLNIADDLAAFTSAQLFGVSSDETGSGLLVGSIAPTFSTTIVVTGISTLTGGFTVPTMTPVVWATGGAVISVTGGNDTAPTSGPRWFTEVQIPYNVTLTGIAFLVGSVGGTDSVVVDLYNSAGTLVASSISDPTSGAAAIVAATATIQSVPFTATYAATAGKHYISIAFNGTTARFRTYTIPGSPFVADTQAGTFRTAASITPGTTFTANEGPISMTY